eukprot:9470662-Pyramimonas_sp.AAC.1
MVNGRKRCRPMGLILYRFRISFGKRYKGIADRARYSRRWSRYTVATYRSLLLSLPRAYQRVLRHSLRELVSGYFAAYNYQWPPLGWEEFLEAAPRVRETLALPY